MAVINTWKINKYPVSADTAKAEFDRIYSSFGELTPKNIVSESRADTAPLHPCFEWDDEIAAEKYRERQAGDMVRCLVTVEEHENNDPITVRAFVKTTERYEPITVTVQNEHKLTVLLQNIATDIEILNRKYSNIEQFNDFFDSVDAAFQQLQISVTAEEARYGKIK